MSFVDYLPPGISIDDLIVVVSALSSLSVVLLVWYALAPADRGAKRARMLSEQRKAMKAGIAGPVRRQNKERAASTSFMHDVVNKLQLLKSTHAEKTAIKLLRAGWRDKDALVYYLFFKLLLPFVLGGVAVVATFVFDAYDLDLTRKMAVCVGAVVLGAYLPDLIIKNQTQKRRDPMPWT
jgi:tight adherence protein C